MNYQVTARKWRPMVFEDVVGQSHVTSTLRNAIATNRVAHAYIFSGTRGCGKTTTARILAKALNCLSPVDNNPDNKCKICEEITSGRSLDVIEIDGASNRGVEEIRNLRESVRYTPAHGKYKIYIIDEVHMLTKEAFNALLKTLEEPPAHVIFVFATTEVHKVPMTILSRCQRFDFRRIAVDEIVERIKFIAKEEGVTLEDGALMIIAKKGDGSLRDAQSIFDQVRAFCGNNIQTEDVRKALNVVDEELFFRVTSLMRNRDVRGGIEIVDEIMRSGYDLREFVGGLAEHLRNFLIVLTTGSTQLLEISEVSKKRYQAEANGFSEYDIVRLMKQVNDLEQNIRWAPQPRFKLEAALLQMIKMDSAVLIDNLLRQIDVLKKKLDGQTAPGEGSTGRASNAAGEVKVVGSVSAGRLKPGVAMSYSSYATSARSSPALEFQPSTMTQPAISSPVLTQDPEPQALARLRTVSTPGAEAVTRWPDFVSDVLRMKIAVGTTLSESSLLDVGNGFLRIACPDDYHLSTLKRHKEFLADAFQRVTGNRVSIEPVLHKVLGDGSKQSPQGTGIHQGQSPENGNRDDEHPLLAVLKRELGAERVE